MPDRLAEYTRYALFYIPPAQAGWAQFATRWLGWDSAAGQTVHHPDLPLPIADITQAPRKYGLHGTIKPPFRLAPGTTRSDLETACADLCCMLAPVNSGPLRLIRLGRFLALCPEPSAEMCLMAATCVRALDRFRAKPAPDELAKRRAAHLTPRQETNLTNWGYPHVMDDFRFHITLTGRLQKPGLAQAQTALETALAPLLPGQFRLNDLALAGEDQQGRFHLLRRFELSATK